MNVSAVVQDGFLSDKNITALVQQSQRLVHIVQGRSQHLQCQKIQLKLSRFRGRRKEVLHPRNFVVASTAARVGVGAFVNFQDPTGRGALYVQTALRDGAAERVTLQFFEFLLLFLLVIGQFGAGRRCYCCTVVAVVVVVA